MGRREQVCGVDGEERQEGDASLSGDPFGRPHNERTTTVIATASSAVTAATAVPAT